MNTIKLGKSSLVASQLGYGCWRIAESGGHAAVRAAYEAGYTLFDGADIYGGGQAEVILGETLRQIPDMRERILITSKCGVRRAGEPNAERRNAGISPPNTSCRRAKVHCSASASRRLISTCCIARIISRTLMPSPARSPASTTRARCDALA